MALPHATIAKLVDAIAAAKPAVVALDILFAEQDSRSPAALARQLGMLTDRTDFLALADTLPDGDQLLASVGRKAPLVFGFVLDPEGRRSLPHAPILVRNQPRLDSIWNASGAVAPITKLTTAASGLGALSLPAESDGVVRYVPLLAAVGDQLMPGLSIEFGPSCAWRVVLSAPVEPAHADDGRPANSAQRGRTLAPHP